MAIRKEYLVLYASFSVDYEHQLTQLACDGQQPKARLSGHVLA